MASHLNTLEDRAPSDFGSAQVVSPRFHWTFNSLGQGPCLMSRILLDQCEGWGSFYRIQPLDKNNESDRYYPPKGDQTMPCICSMPVYNLIQVCAAAQVDSAYSYDTDPWDAWTKRCSASITYRSSFPYPISNDTTIPLWAYTDFSNGATDIDVLYSLYLQWNATQDQSSSGGYGSISEASTPAASKTVTSSTTVTTSTTVDQSSSTPAFGDVLEPAPTSTDSSSTSSSATIGAVVAVVVILLALLVGGAFFIRRRRRRRAGRQLQLGSTDDLASSSRTLSMQQTEKLIPSIIAPGRHSSSYASRSSEGRRLSRFSSFGSMRSSQISYPQSRFSPSLAPTDDLISLNTDRLSRANPFSDIYRTWTQSSGSSSSQASVDRASPIQYPTQVATRPRRSSSSTFVPPPVTAPSRTASTAASTVGASDVTAAAAAAPGSDHSGSSSAGAVYADRRFPRL